MAVTVREAGPEDAARLAELRYEFRAAVDPPVEPEDEFRGRCARWIRERLSGSGSGWRCWLLEEGGEIFGQVWLGLVEKVPNPVDEVEAHAYLTNMYVREDRRGKGLGTRLLEAALEWCRANEIGSVILWPTERSRPLYERHGFRVTGDLLELPLNPASCAVPESVDGGGGPGADRRA